jgi:hypothetical protein
MIAIMRNIFSRVSAMGALFVLSGLATSLGGTAMAEERDAAMKSNNVNQVADIGSKRQFWFNAQGLVDESTYLKILQQRPVKHPANPILVADKPWEGTLVQLYSCDVHHDPTTGQWQMWYEGHSPDVLLCTAFSKDGLRWTKPKLGLQEWKGSKNNNIILQTGYTDANCASIVKAPNEKDPARKYKLYYWVGPEWFNSHIKPMGFSPEEEAAARNKIKAYKRNGLYVAFSADGVNFTPQTNAPVVAGGIQALNGDFGDTSFVQFDEQAGCYRAYLRFIRNKRRAYSMAESDDGVKFKTAVPVLDPTPDDDAWAKINNFKRAEFYGVHVWPQDGFYLGMLWMFTISGMGIPALGMGGDDGKNQPHLIYSTDGVKWQRMPVREPFIPCGPAGSFEAGSIYTAGDRQVVIGDEIRFYYFGVGNTHGDREAINSPNLISGFGLATLPRDRYVAWQGAAVAGTLLTKPLRFAGRELRLNLDASRGETRVALLDADGKPFAGFGAEDCEAITRDGFDQVVKWRGTSDLSALAGKVIRVQFSLRQSALYTWQFK